MFSRMSIIRSTGNYSDKIERLRDAFDAADAVVIGAGAGGVRLRQPRRCHMQMTLSK